MLEVRLDGARTDAINALADAIEASEPLPAVDSDPILMEYRDALAKLLASGPLGDESKSEFVRGTLKELTGDPVDNEHRDQDTSERGQLREALADRLEHGEEETAEPEQEGRGCRIRQYLGAKARAFATSTPAVVGGAIFGAAPGIMTGGVAAGGAAATIAWQHWRGQQPKPIAETLRDSSESTLNAKDMLAKINRKGSLSKDERASVAATIFVESMLKEISYPTPQEDNAWDHARPTAVKTGAGALAAFAAFNVIGSNGGNGGENTPKPSPTFIGSVEEGGETPATPTPGVSPTDLPTDIQTDVDW